MEASTIQETDEQRAARLEAEQEALDRGGELDRDGRDLPEGAADDGDNIGPAPAGGTVDAQDSMFDRVVEDAELEAVLDEREKRRLKRLAANTSFKEKDDAARGKLDALDLPDDTVVRCGRHRISVKRTDVTHVSFDRGGKRQISIDALD